MNADEYYNRVGNDLWEALFAPRKDLTLKSRDAILYPQVEEVDESTTQGDEK